MSDTPQLSEADQRAIARRERQRAKLANRGANRLASIASAAGRPLAAASETATNKGTSAESSPKPTSAGDHESQTPGSKPDGFAAGVPSFSPLHSGRETPDAALLRDFRRQMLPPEMAADTFVEPSLDLDPSALLKMMMGGQMPGMGSADGPNPTGGSPPGFGGPPADLASTLSQISSIVDQRSAGLNSTGRQAQAASSTGLVWRLIHAVFSLSLGAYLALAISFRGTSDDRTEETRLPSLKVGPFGHVNPFMLFLTAELLLQTTRFLMDRAGPGDSGGMLSSAAAFLPSPYGDYIRTLGKYWKIYSTISTDVLCVIFVLGCAAWWNGSVV